ncbi:MAG TPA: efflux RND transporter periplasmic adaptor subunit [Xanthobacteraceae bacterium]|jgi:multidrug efflux system membrane fusion protein|nr:efflux RND transporter periplasmic adaptor subunit [Xanthobacteraceae bacterium]
MIRKRYWLGLPVLLMLGAAGFLYLTRGETSSAKAVSAPALPVTATTAQRQHVSVYLNGLGNVVAFNRVTVHVRVDGELQAVDFVEGQDVKQGDQLALIDPRPFQAQLDQAEAAKARDEAQLANARLDLERYTSLVAKDYATRQSVDTQQALIAQLQATIRGDQAAIENAQTQLSYTSIVSPLDGRTGMRLIDRGNIVHASDPGGLVVITQVHPIAVVFSLPQDHLQDITAAMKAGALKVLAYSRDEKTKIAEGNLTLIDNQIDASTGTIRLKAVFPNNDDALWPGEFVQAHLEIEDLPAAVTIPAEVVQRGPNELYVYVVRPDSTVERRRVTVGPVQDGVAVIEKGLDIGDEVVLDGQFKLKPGMTVVVSNPRTEQKASVPERTAARERSAP